MESKDYMQLLANEYDSKELSKDDFISTLKHYAELYHKEQNIKTIIEQDFLSSIKMLDYFIIFFHVVSSADLKHKRETMLEQYNNWKKQ